VVVSDCLREWVESCRGEFQPSEVRLAVEQCVVADQSGREVAVALVPGPGQADPAPIPVPEAERRSAGQDVVVHPEHVGRVVGLLCGRQTPVALGAVGLAQPLGVGGLFDG
jgi:hypothetical protein